MAETLREHPRPGSNSSGQIAPTYAIQERAVSENPNAGPQGAGWKEEEAYTLEARHHVQMVAVTDRQCEAVSGGADLARRESAAAGSFLPAVAAPLELAYALRKDPGGIGQGHNTNFVAGPLGGGNDGIGRRSEDDPNTVVQAGVRRLTPTECERLQGLPDGWTQLGGTPDSRRYSALGDAVTATVAEWLGQRIKAAA